MTIPHIRKQIFEKINKHAKATSYRVHFTDEARKECHNKKWGPEKYSIQDHVESQTPNFPADYYTVGDITKPDDASKSDYYQSFYTDRLSQEQKQAIAPLVQYHSFQNFSQEQLIELGTILSGRDDITAVRIVRDTMVFSGYPLWHFDVFAKNPLAPRSLMTWHDIHLAERAPHTLPIVTGNYSEARRI